MNSKELVSKEIAQAIDILEQIEDVNRMISVHQTDQDDMMTNQYQYRKENLVKEFSNLLQKFNINPNDLAA